jgi:hypothetical protein
LDQQLIACQSSSFDLWDVQSMIPIARHSERSEESLREARSTAGGCIEGVSNESAR